MIGILEALFVYNFSKRQIKAQPLFLQGDPLFSAFWDRVINKREETVFGSVVEGLDRIQAEQAVMHMSVGMLKGYFKANPFRQQAIKTFARGKGTYYALIVPINSPLKPIMQFASNKLLESGAMDYLQKQWEGNYATEKFL